MSQLVDIAIAARLLDAVRRIESESPDLAIRRQRILQGIGEIISADLGHWASGRGFPGRNEVTPIAEMNFGFSDEQLQLWRQLATDRDTDNYRERVRERFGDRNYAVFTRCDIMTDDEWQRSQMRRQYMKPMGVDSFVHGVTYPSPDSWYHMAFFRRLGKNEFTPTDAAVVELAMVGIDWLAPQTAEVLPAEKFVGLTPRQRAVLLMQLEGLSRKQIATNLEITEQTVGDHLKALYKHFDVHSASELAAHFLRGA